jgi:hypothetical protein
LAQVLGLDVEKTKRLQFHEITKPAIEEAIKESFAYRYEPRQLARDPPDVRPDHRFQAFELAAEEDVEQIGGPGSKRHPQDDLR